MKMKKKLIPFLLTLGILLGTTPLVHAEGNALFSVQFPTVSPRVGEKYTVTVSLTNNPGICAAQFFLTLDKDAVECVDITPGPLLADMVFAENPDDKGTAHVAAASLTPSREDGVLASFVLRAKRDGTPDLPLTVVALTEESGKAATYEIRKKESAPDSTASPQPSGSTGGNLGSTSKPSSGFTSKPTMPPFAPPKPFSPTDDVNGAEKVPTMVEQASEQDVIQYPDIVAHWGKDYIQRASHLGLFQGYPDGSFRPEEQIRRGQFVTVLWRLAGKPGTEGSHPFIDVTSQSKEFQTAITWSYGQGYVKGMTATTFEPDGFLSRQEAMTILYRYSGSAAGMEAMFSQVYEKAFTDSAEIADWAKPAVHWGIYHQLLQGMGDGILSPRTHVTRAQMAKIMVEYTEKIQNGGRVK